MLTELGSEFNQFYKIGKEKTPALTREEAMEHLPAAIEIISVISEGRAKHPNLAEPDYDEEGNPRIFRWGSQTYELQDGLYLYKVPVATATGKTATVYRETYKPYLLHDEIRTGVIRKATNAGIIRRQNKVIWPENGEMELNFLILEEIIKKAKTNL